MLAWIKNKISPQLEFHFAAVVGHFSGSPATFSIQRYVVLCCFFSKYSPYICTYLLSCLPLRFRWRHESVQYGRDITGLSDEDQAPRSLDHRLSSRCMYVCTSLLSCGNKFWFQFLFRFHLIPTWRPYLRSHCCCCYVLKRKCFSGPPLDCFSWSTLSKNIQSQISHYQHSCTNE